MSSANESGVDFLLMEMIPGPDSVLCSYYTYIDDAGSPLFDFTKRIIRRGTKNMGIATYHITDHVEVVYDLDVEARKTCEKLGMRMQRVPCVNDHPEFIRMLVEKVRVVAGTVPR